MAMKNPPPAATPAFGLAKRPSSAAPNIMAKQTEDKLPAPGMHSASLFVL